MQTTIYILLFFVLIFQMIAIWRNKPKSKTRLVIKVCLNLMLWIALLLFVINTKWNFNDDNNKRFLVVANNVPSHITQKIKDSLALKVSFSETKFEKIIDDNPNFEGDVFLLGQNFSSLFLSKLYAKNSKWIPYFEPDKLRKIHWSGIIRKGETQKISGEIESSKLQLLKIKYGNTVLDSLKLKKGLNYFEFSFPVFGLGETLLTLSLEDKDLEDIHFFAQKTQAISIQFILENPDFEAKILAEWLGKQGHQVQITTQTTKNTVSTISINKQKQNEPDLIVTSPANASNLFIKKALTAGKSVLFIGFTDTEEEIKNLPLKIGLHRTTNEESIKITENLTAQPFQFTPKSNQKILNDYPILIQNGNSKIAVSLLNETYPLKLSGDTLLYSKIWGSVLQQLQPIFKDNMDIYAPIFQDLETKISFNYLSKDTRNIKIASDTIQKIASAINSKSSALTYVFRNSGWQTLGDSINVFVDKLTMDNGQEIMRNLPTKNNSHSSLIIHHPSLSAWFWFFLILFFLVALWIEPKV